MSAHFYTIAMSASAVASFALALTLIRRRAAPGALPLAVLGFSVGVWALASAFRIEAPSLAGKIFWHKVELLGMAPIDVSWFWFCAMYSGRARWVRPRVLAPFMLVHAVTIGLGFTNEYHHLLWTELHLDTAGPFPVLHETAAAWWWVDTVQVYTLVVVGLAMLLGLFIRSPWLYRRQVGAVVLAALALLSADIVYVFGVEPTPRINLAPVTFTLVVLLLFWGFVRYHLLDIVPAARDQVIESMGDAVVVVDARSRVIDLNPAGARLAGRSVSDAVGGHVQLVFPQLWDLLCAGLRGEPVSGELQLESQGQSRYYDLGVSPLRNRRDVDQGHLLVLRDVTERRLAQQELVRTNDDLERRVEARTAELRVAVEALRRSQGRVEHLLSSNPAVIYSCLPKGDFPITFVSPNVKHLLGYSAEEFILGENLWDSLLHPDDQDVVAEMSDIVSRGEGASEYRMRRRDGRWIWVHDEMRLVSGGNDASVEMVGSWLDITDRREMEDRLRQSQKMEAVGLLAGGVAHDFNNLLTAIFGSSALLLATLPAEDARRLDVLEIQEAAERAAGLTRQLLAFSRGQVLKPRVLQPNSVIRAMEPMLRRLLGERIEFVVELDEALGLVKADPNQLEQVVMNLVINARDAMAGGGRLTVRSANVVASSGHAGRPGGGMPAEQVVLSVRDTGHGMDADTLAHLFEPFYTTKRQDKGTGLGLATVYGIVTQSGGYVTVDSRPGKGATFSVYLPRTNEALPPESLEDPQGPSRAAIGGRLLLVEDEAAVRRLAARTLRAHGFEVFEAAGGDEAVALFGRERSIELVITDMVMPGMSGQDLAERLRRTNPTVKVLYMSGYSKEQLSIQASRRSAFLEKPFTPDSLVRKVKEILNL